jgi:hypothetical protein
MECLRHRVKDIDLVMATLSSATVRACATGSLCFPKVCVARFIYTWNGWARFTSVILPRETDAFICPLPWSGNVAMLAARGLESTSFQQLNYQLTAFG